MNIERVTLSRVKTNKNNPRKISDSKFDKLLESLLVFPKMLDLRPLVVDESNVVLGGNMRLKALKKIAAWDEADITTRLRQSEDYNKLSDGDKDTLLSLWREWLTKPLVPIVKAADLSESEKRQFIIKDNASFGDWDWDIAFAEWGDVNFESWGVDVPDIFNVDDGESEEKEAKEDNYTDEDIQKVEKRVKRGDIWLLGEHRLMCGDSTNGGDFSLLMDGEKADITFTSPPYNVQKGFSNEYISKSGGRAYLSEEGRVYDEYSDDVSDEEYSKLLCDALANSLQYSYDVFFNIGTTAGALKGTASFLGKNAKNFAGVICWKKSGAFVPGFAVQHGILRNIQEPIYYFNVRGTRKVMFPQWKKGYSIDNYFESKNASTNEFSTQHKATFPIELPFHFVKNFTKSSVLDPFGGTGTTLMAAEQLGRKCFMMELSENYCDIILDRWEKLTNKRAEKAQTV